MTACTPRQAASRCSRRALLRPMMQCCQSVTSSVFLYRPPQPPTEVFIIGDSTSVCVCVCVIFSVHWSGRSKYAHCGWWSTIHCPLAIFSKQTQHHRLIPIFLHPTFRSAKLGFLCRGSERTRVTIITYLPLTNFILHTYFAGSLDNFRLETCVRADPVSFFWGIWGGGGSRGGGSAKNDTFEGSKLLKIASKPVYPPFSDP